MNESFEKPEKKDKVEKPVEGITHRIAKESANPQIVDQLLEMSPSTLQSLLIMIARERTRLKSPADILNEYESKESFFRPSDFDQLSLLRLQELQLRQLSEFEPIHTAQVVPQGINAVLTAVSQDISLPTIRNSEVAGDPTISLAIEASHRRRENKGMVVNLATSQHVLRMQPFDKEKGYMQHFLLLGLCTAGKSAERFEFLYDALRKHIKSNLDILATMNMNGYHINDIEVLLSDMSIIEQIIDFKQADRAEINRNSLNPDFKLFDYLHVNLPDVTSGPDELSDESLEEAGILDRKGVVTKMDQEILLPLKQEYQNIKFGFELSRKGGLGYYDKSCFHIFGTNDSGEKIQLCDGGRVNWTAKLLNDRKELCVISGMGTELIHKLFRV